MRVAPVGIGLRFQDDRTADIEGAEIAALTHSHSLGFMPAAFLTHVIKHLVSDDDPIDLLGVIHDASDMIRSIYPARKHLGVFMDLIDKAVLLSSNNSSDIENITSIGSGWCGDEALAIAVYCALKYQNDFSAAITAAVNHSGDSDSTGALTGNIVGALCGYEAIDPKWKDDLELKNTILEISDDLCYGCLMDGNGEYKDEIWLDKYVNSIRR